MNKGDFIWQSQVSWYREQLSAEFNPTEILKHLHFSMVVFSHKTLFTRFLKGELKNISTAEAWITGWISYPCLLNRGFLKEIEFEPENVLKEN